jgi:hypothetical protein
VRPSQIGHNFGALRRDRFSVFTAHAAYRRCPRLRLAVHAQSGLLSAVDVDMRFAEQLHHVRRQRSSSGEDSRTTHRSPVSIRNVTAFSQCSVGNICSVLQSTLNTTCLATPGQRTVISLVAPLFCLAAI